MNMSDRDRMPIFDPRLEVGPGNVNRRDGAKPSIRRGNTITMVRPPVLSAKAAPELYVRGPLSGEQRLITVEMSDLEFPEQRGPGSWVLALSSRVTVGETGVDVNLVCPLVCKIEFGAGAVTQTIEVDAWRNIIALPAETVRCFLYWEGIGPCAYPNTDIMPNWLPREVEVTATIHRTQETGTQVPTRSYWCLDDSQSFIVPRYSQAWRMTSRAAPPAGSDKVGVTLLESGALLNSGYYADVPSDAQVSSMRRTLCSRFIPPNAEVLTVDIADLASDPQNTGKLIFELGF
jgi:hypothetical protein